MIRAALRFLATLVAGYAILVAAGLAVFRFLDPPATPLMAIRALSGEAVDHRPVPIELVSPVLRRSVVAAEDARFCLHAGIDFQAVQEAIEDYEETGRARGASTITMQLARNLFLWPGGGAARKAIEAPIALALDALWPKRRILEVYLQVAEWGPGMFGAEAAARRHFGKAAAALGPREAATMAAVLPSPIRWSAARPTAHVLRRAGTIDARADRLGRDLTRCFL